MISVIIELLKNYETPLWIFGACLLTWWLRGIVFRFKNVEKKTKDLSTDFNKILDDQRIVSNNLKEISMWHTVFTKKLDKLEELVAINATDISECKVFVYAIKMQGKKH